MSGSSGIRANLKASGVDVLNYVSDRKKAPTVNSYFSKVTDFFTLPPFPTNPKPVLLPTPKESFLFTKIIEPASKPVAGFLRKTAIYGVIVLVVAALLFFFVRGLGARLAGAT